MITAQHVERVLHSIPGAYGRQVTSLEILAAGANEALAAAPAGLTVQGAAAFLATMSQESASFRATEEFAKHGRYAPFIGRTFEMITWATNYAAFGAWCKERGLVDDAAAFTSTPRKLADVRWAWLGGVWFWQKNGLWSRANDGDFLATQRAVNLGSPTSSATPAGMPARSAWYSAWLKVGADLITTPIAPPKIGPKFMDNVWINYAGGQQLSPGDNEIKINDKGDKTLVSGASDGVDLLATVDVADAAGHPVPGVRAFFRVVSYKTGTPTTTTSSRRPTTSDQVSFKGSVTKDKAADRTPRLRLVVSVPAGVTGAVLRSVQVSGWTL